MRLSPIASKLWLDGSLPDPDLDLARRSGPAWKQNEPSTRPRILPARSGSAPRPEEAAGRQPRRLSPAPRRLCLLRVGLRAGRDSRAPHPPSAHRRRTPLAYRLPAPLRPTDCPRLRNGRVPSGMSLEPAARPVAERLVPGTRIRLLGLPAEMPRPLGFAVREAPPVPSAGKPGARKNVRRRTAGLKRGCFIPLGDLFL